jgi:hypothetical protein
MNKKNIRWWVDGAYDFLNLLVGIVVLVPFVIVIPVISVAGAIIGLSRTSSFDTSTYLQGQRMTGTTISLSENEIRIKILEQE